MLQNQDFNSLAAVTQNPREQTTKIVWIDSLTRSCGWRLRIHTHLCMRLLLCESYPLQLSLSLSYSGSVGTIVVVTGFQNLASHPTSRVTRLEPSQWWRCDLDGHHYALPLPTLSISLTLFLLIAWDQQEEEELSLFEAPLSACVFARTKGASGPPFFLFFWFWSIA